MTKLLLYSVANQTTKPVFDAILEATGENGRTTGKSFDDKKVKFGTANAGSDTDDTYFLSNSLFALRSKISEKCGLSALRAKCEKFD